MTGQAPALDYSMPFLLHRGAFRGRLIRLPETTSDILTRHDYPPPVSQLVAETAALATSLAFSMKFDGIFSLQAKGDGPVSMLIADVTSNGDIRAYAQYDEERLGEIPDPHGEEANVQRLLGAGHLAFTVDQGPETNRYQGIVELTGNSLTECVHKYFRQSEQLETAIKVASARTTNGEGTGWRAAALMLQRMPIKAGGHNDPGLDPEEADDAWRTAVILLGSLTNDELLDPDLPGETVLTRLFHQERLGIAEPQSVRFGCRCSRERVERTLQSFPRAELEDMKLDDGTISVCCQFCSEEYIFTDADLDTLFPSGKGNTVS